MASFSTRGIPASRKVSYWNEVTSEIFARMEVRPSDTAGFDGTLSRDRIGPLTVMDVVSSAVQIRHTRAHIAAMSDPSYLLVTPLKRDFVLAVDHAPRIRVQAGEFCLIDHARPYELIHGDAVRTLCLDVPRRHMEQQISTIADVVGKLLRPDNGMSRILVGLLRSLGHEAQADGMDSFPAVFGQNILDLITSAFRPYASPLKARGVKGRAALYCAYIESRQRENDLTPATVSAHFGVSERYLRAVLKVGGETFSEFLLRVRLMRCAEDLSASNCETRTITDIAFSAGFNSNTYFGQSFKRRFGVTPTEYRRGARSPE